MSYRNASDIRQSAMDLTTRSFDLTRALIDLSSAYSMKDVGLRIAKWLARERIDDASFTACCKLASSLAYPNARGMEIQTRLQDADKKIMGIQHAPINLVVSGSLGRLLSQDPEYCYMVSSVAALTEFHEPRHVAEILGSMVLDKGGHQEEVSYRYSVQRDPITAVISKIVESIYVNVVNSGHSMGGLPEGLKQLHPHLLDTQTFAGIVMGIQRSDKDVVIVSDRFTADLAAWLLCHFDGTFQAVVKTRIVFEERLGAVSRRIKLLVKNECPADGTCMEQDATLVASESVGNSTFTFLRGHDETDIRPCSYARQDLYSTTNLMSLPNQPRANGLSTAHENHITAVAKKIVLWLLGIPLKYQSPALKYSFGADIRENAKAEGVTVGYLLANHPRIAQKKTGEFAMSGPTFRVGDEPDKSSWLVSNPEPADVIKCFPYAQALLEDMGMECNCAHCVEALPNLRETKPGCLRFVAVTKLLLLIGHAIADGFGAQNVSGSGDPDIQTPLVVEVLWELIYDHVVNWNTWFRLVAAIATGSNVEVRGIVEDRESSISSYVAIQHGNFVAAAPWIDLTKQIEIRGSFGLTFLEGNIAGLPDEYGVLECERAEYEWGLPKSWKPQSSTVETKVKTRASKNEQIELSIPGPERRSETIAAMDDARQIDTFKAKVVSALFRVDDYLYRYMTTVEAGTTLVLIDPTNVLVSLKHSSTPTCSHKSRSEDEESAASNIHVRTDDFERILSRWNPAGKQTGNRVIMSKLLDTRLKMNVALSLANSACIIRDPKHCCMDCAVMEGTRPEFTGSYIINSAVITSTALQSTYHAW
ncbi:MAG: hypothetical protein Q9172_004037 [Xanthocarpia lactea]